MKMADPPHIEMQYQESCNCLSSSRQTVRAQMAFFGAVIAGILGFVYSKDLSLDTRAYLGVSAILFTGLMFTVHKAMVCKISYFKTKVEFLEANLKIDITFQRT